MKVMINSDQNKTGTHLDADNANHMIEWGKARDVLKDFDDHLHDLRKYGFSFLTVLLGAESLLIPTRNMPTEVKFAVFAVTLLLIAALHLLDKNYRVFQQAANTRAEVLERKLNLELSETISVRHGMNHIDIIVVAVYFLFIFGVILLGGFVLEPHWGYFIMLVIFAVVIAMAPVVMLNLRFKNKHFKEDWTISPLECTQSDSLRITLTNMGSSDEPIKFLKGAPMWIIKNIDGVEVSSKNSEREIEVYDIYTWFLKPCEFPNGGLKKGVYQLQPRDWKLPLPISIIVLD